jgi:aryl-alcohol dehydrogenase-like predicted oxidoreductase
MTRRAELGLGTAPFGMRSGVGSAAAPVREAERRAILDAAAEARVTLVDTAPRYGDCERLLGQSWPFPSPFRVIAKTIPLAEGLHRLEARARRSLDHMGLPRAHALVVERPEDLMGPEGRLLWATLEKLKDEGLYQKIGVSVGASDEPVHLARRFRPDLIQISCSMLDQRAARTGVLSALKDLGAEVQLRSIFLRGLLFLPREALPRAIADAGPALSRVRRILAECGADPLQAALAYAFSRTEASSVIVGVASAAELRAILAAAAAPAPDLDWSELSLDHPAALDPSLWLGAPAALSAA